MTFTVLSHRTYVIYIQSSHLRTSRTLSFSVNGIIIHPATQGRNLEIRWNLHPLSVTTCKQSPSSSDPLPSKSLTICLHFNFSLASHSSSSDAKSPCTLIPASLLVWTVSLTLDLTLSNSFFIWQPDLSPPRLVLQRSCSAIKVKSNSLSWFARTCIIWSLPLSPESCLSRTPPAPTICPSFFYSSVSYYCAPAVLWTCQWRSARGVFIWYSSCLEYSFTLESHWACSFHGFGISFNCLLTEAFPDLPVKLQAMLPASSRPGPYPALFFCAALFATCYTLHFIHWFSGYLAHKNVVSMMAESLVCFVLWYVS